MFILKSRITAVGFDLSTIKPTSLGMRIMRERADAIHAHLQDNKHPGKRDDGQPGLERR